MKSKITIEIDFQNGNQPVLRVVRKQSDDVRDDLVQALFNALDHDAPAFLKVEYEGNRPYHDADLAPGETLHAHVYKLTPIKEDELVDAYQRIGKWFEGKMK